MMLPAGILFALFFLWPFISGFWLSFHRWDGFSDPRFIGFGNYWRLMKDGVFLLALKNSFIFVVVSILAKNVLGLALALLLNRVTYLRGFIRASVFVPVTISFVAAGLLWAWIYNPVFGLLNAGLDFVGLASWKRSWLGDANVALYAVIVVDVWKWLGFHAVIYLAGLQTIPSELYEAARIDGANARRRFWHITLPLMVPVIFINTILSLSGAFVRNFDIVHVLTQGGPNHATEVVITAMVKAAFTNSQMGYAAAMGYALFVLVGALCAALVYLLGRTRFKV
ncbi:MAG: sugar ABC transporter permease [Candidatus Kaistia colombiensis]|nr:MAG: sugar ABC transporter permease [Kaistia sp.]